MKKSKEAHDLNIGYHLGMPSEKAWEKHFPMSAEGYGDDPAGAFLPRPGKDRAQPHQKINECDH
jgi:hypothetical protein